MTIWLLALVLLASCAGLGYRQGAIRVAFSFAGILLGAVLAVPVGHLISRVLAPLGLKQPVLAWALGPCIAFILISMIFKAAAAAVHHKVEMYYKYKAGDLRVALWERLNHRLGLCLGVANGAAYLILISFVVYVVSYWTVQVATAETDSKSMRLVNQMGHDLQTTGFATVARALDPLPRAYYDAADVAGLLYHNSLLEARLARYPDFLGLAERSEFQAIANDKEFTEMRQRQEPIMTILNQGAAQSIMQNPDLLRLIWTTVVPDLTDLRIYFETGKSPKFDQEKILGRWDFNPNAALWAIRRAKPKITPKEMQVFKNWMLSAFSKTTMVAMTDHQVLLKNLPQIKLGDAVATTDGQTVTGQWKNVDGRYQLALNGAELPAVIEGDRLTIKNEALELVFDRED